MYQKCLSYSIIRHLSVNHKMIDHQVLMSSTPPKSTATPEELIRCTRQMTVATARAVAAGNANKQDQLTAAANLGRKTVVDLLIACKVR